MKLGRIHIVALLVGIIIVVSAVLYIFALNGTDHGGNGGLFGSSGGAANIEHKVLTYSGENHHPKIDGNKIYWIDSATNKITVYDIGSESTSQLSPVDDPTHLITEIFPDGDIIFCDILIKDSNNPLNISYRYGLYNIGTDDIQDVNISGFAAGFTLQYPHLIYHNFTGLYQMDLVTNVTITINDANWASVSGDYIAYSFDGTNGHEAHLYQISSGTDVVVMTSDLTGLNILLKNDKCTLLETHDTGPTAETTIYLYDIPSGELVETGTFNDWMMGPSFDGKFILWSDGGSSPGSTIKIMNVETGDVQNGPDNQWVASLAMGPIYADTGLAVWGSNYQIQMLTIE